MSNSPVKPNHPLSLAIGEALGTLSRLEAEAVEAGTPEAFWRQPQVVRLLDQLFAASEDDFYIYDRAGRYLYCSERGTLNEGLTRDGLIGRTWQAFDIPGPFLKPLEARMRSVFETGRPISDESALPVAGVLRRFSYTYAPIADASGRVQAVVTAVRDVTDERTRDEALRASEEKWRTLVESTPSMVLMLDPNARITFINRTASGRLPDQIVGMSLYDLTPAAQHEDLRRAFEHAREHGQAHFDMPGPDGKGRTAQYQSTIGPMRQHGELVGYVLIVTDVSELKEATQAVAQRTAELDRARELDRLKSNFVNAVTHELRTPLTSIKGYAEFLEDGIGGELSSTQLNFVHQLLAGTERLERLVDDLLDFARIEAGTFTLKIAETDLVRKIHEVIDSLRPQAEDARLKLSSDGLRDPICVPMDAQRIGQVLINLVNNAIKFTPPGGTITVCARVEPGVVRCEVVDSGIGIQHDEIPKLFQRFSQLESGLRAGTGTGLGLSIAKTIVETHGGAIGVESTPGRGSTFWFTLPLEPATSETPTAAPPERP